MKTILLIDDEINLLNAYSLMLEKKGYHILKANDGNEGLKVILSEDVDLVISDIYMPRKSGLVVIKQIRRILKYRNIPIIILSAGGTKKNVFRGIELGVDAFLAKPCKKEELYQTVEKVLKSNNNLAVNKYENSKINNKGWERPNDISILLVYKNARVTDNLYEFLTEHFYKIYIEENIEKVKDIINKKNINLLIFEVCSPDENNFKFLIDIYSQNKYIRIPIIIISEMKNEMEKLLNCLDSQVYKIIMKPFKYINLLKSISQVIDSKYLSEKLALLIKNIGRNKEKETNIINALRNEAAKLKSENLKIFNNRNILMSEKFQICCDNNQKIMILINKISKTKRIFLKKRQNLLEAKRIIEIKLKYIDKKRLSLEA